MVLGKLGRLSQKGGRDGRDRDDRRGDRRPQPRHPGMACTARKRILPGAGRYVRKVLAIDGGGIRGVLPAALLATVEDSLGEPVVDYFDLVTGTSTGGIIALGLASGLSAHEILDFYLEHGPGVFCGPKLPRKLRQWALGKYDAGGLSGALDRVFGDRRLGESMTRVVIPAVNLET